MRLPLSGVAFHNSPKQILKLNMDWKGIARTRQEYRSRTFQLVDPPIPDLPSSIASNVTNLPSTLLTQDVLSITGKDAETLIKELATGTLTSTAVTKAFLQRAGLASRLTNCVTELLTEQAVQRAEFLDEHFSKHGPIGPLHGLPISVKEHISMKGLDVNTGFISWVGRIGPDDALILKLLWRAGAVFHARTTEPQTLMHLETSSNIYGVTVNPYNTNLTSGGSSGGEGALLGMKGSCLGIGTDIGGSIRSPAANNGVYGLRPTSYRLPLDGFAATMLGEEQIIPVVGPLSASLEGIKLFMKILIDQKPWLYEPSLIPMPWRDTSTNSLLRKGEKGQPKLRIGVLVDDGIVRPHPPIQRGIKTVVDKLKDHPDIDIVEFPAYKHDEAWRIIASLYFADGAQEEIEAIEASGEPWMPLSNFIIQENSHLKSLTVPEVWKLTCEREAYKAAYARHWNSIGTSIPGPESGSNVVVLENADALQDNMVDVVLCPVGPGVAPLLNTARYWNYTSQWNLLDYPALVFPTGLACGSEDEVERAYKPRNEQDAYNHSLYDPVKYADAPISLQLVGRRFEDEKVIEALEFMLKVSGMSSSNGSF